MTNKYIIKYRELFDGEPMLFRSPGRINLLGEHTDYNQGFVLPAAIDKAVYFAIGVAAGSACRLHALDLDDDFEFQSSDIKPSPKGWPNYIMGVIDQFKRQGFEIRGFNCVVGGDIPMGAGLSSSAAIEGGLAFAINELFNFGLEKTALVKIAHQAENEFVGVRCGIMDQFINIFGKKGHAIRIDCRSLDYEYIPLTMGDYSFVLFNSMVKHSLAGSEYNVRRMQCEEAARYFSMYYPNIQNLRDVTPEMIETHRQQLDSTLIKRSQYIVKENLRVLEACRCLEMNDYEGLGRLMFKTHKGLNHEFEVSCEELNFLVEAASAIHGVIGARMVGGGFGGCTINLVLKEQLQPFCERLSDEFYQRYSIKPDYYPVAIKGGTSRIS